MVTRNNWVQAVNVTVDIELAGPNQRKSGSVGPMRIAAGYTLDQQAFSAFGGSLTRTRVSVRVTACTPAV